jgi:3-hydroxyisobutyrate dehydrogenase-like beta-hydroxyacid dehydrogenase
MVKRLLEAGQPVTVYPRGVGLPEVKAVGAQECKDYAALAAQSDALIVIVFDDTQLRDILFNQGMLKALRPGSILTIHVTGSPVLRREIQEQAPAGVAVLDVTFSGSRTQAETGALTLIAGGEAEALERMRPIFKAYAKEIFHVGKLGDAQVLKLLNNLILAANMMNAVELLAVAECYGFNPMTAAQVLQTCSGASFAMGLFQNQPAAKLISGSRRYMEKDVQEALSAAKDIGLDLRAFNQTAAYFLPRS